MPFKRARTNEQINARKKEIIIAAAKLFDEGGIDEVQFKAIGEMTPFARSTIYNYYETKEEILLDLLTEDISDWIYDVNKFTSQYDDLSREDFCLKLMGTFEENYRLTKLLSLLYLTLEKNVSLDKLTNFKAKLFMVITPFQDSLSKFFPNSSQENREIFIFNCLVFVSGLAPFCELSEKQIQAMKNLGHNESYFNFKDSCYNGFIALSTQMNN